jgi:Cu/Ag efflux pump CusA
VLRIRPKAMTVATIFAGLLPIMLPFWNGAALALTSCAASQRP